MTARKWRSPALLFAVLLVLALATLGMGYGLWSKTLYINGTVGTGSVDAVWTYASSSDPPGGLDPPDYEKDVARLDCDINAADAQIIDFVVTNGYPSYRADCQVEFANTGTIPVKVEQITVTPGAGLANCTTTQDPGTGTTTVDCDQLWIKFVDTLCQQVEPSGELASSVRVHVEQDADQNASYAFQVEQLLVQWNESKCP